MVQDFTEILKIGGHANTLGKVDDVIKSVLEDKSKLSILYDCMFDDDPWVRMRAADAIEKICRINPDWLLPYVDRLKSDFGDNPQASIQWHLAQIYRQVKLTESQKIYVMKWLKQLLSSEKIDWIVAANAMETLVYFTKTGNMTSRELVKFLKIQTHHKSQAVVKKAKKYMQNYN